MRQKYLPSLQKYLFRHYINHFSFLVISIQMEVGKSHALYGLDSSSLDDNNSGDNDNKPHGDHWASSSQGIVRSSFQVSDTSNTNKVRWKLGNNISCNNNKSSIVRSESLRGNSDQVILRASILLRYVKYRKESKNRFISSKNKLFCIIIIAFAIFLSSTFHYQSTSFYSTASHF